MRSPLRVSRGLSALLLLAGLASVAESQSTLQRGDAVAVIGATEAKFIFPVDGLRNGMWTIDWTPLRDGTDPYSIWLRFSLLTSGREPKPDELVKPAQVTAMIDCPSCDQAPSEDSRIDPRAFIAGMENHRFVLRVVGREAIAHIFPRIPDRIRFLTEHPQEVLVNCGAGLSSRDYHLRCVVPPFKAPPNLDSAAEVNAPRRVRVMVSDFRDAKLLSNISLVVRTRFRKPWMEITTTALGNAVLMNPPLYEWLFIEATCRGASGSKVVFGTTSVQLRPRADTAVQLMTDPRICRR